MDECMNKLMNERTIEPVSQSASQLTNKPTNLPNQLVGFNGFNGVLTIFQLRHGSQLTSHCTWLT